MKDGWMITWNKSFGSRVVDIINNILFPFLDCLSDHGLDVMFELDESDVFGVKIRRL